MLKRNRYRAYLTRPGQDVAVSKTFGCVRVVCNDVIHARETAHKEGWPFPKSGDLSKQLITQAKRSPEREWLGEVSAVVLQQVLVDADQAYRNFFQSVSGKRKGARAGKPPVPVPSGQPPGGSLHAVRPFQGLAGQHG